ncbi:phosphotransferase [Paenibacillus sp. FSL M8-0334]|uniref:phosphotransferase n=1 Tax=Paenibacillus sp. FSL M8-0334 TaxID=2921623 RepID=UPI0030F9F5A6
MDCFDFRRLHDYYPITPVIEIKEISTGNTSNARLVVTMDNKYIVRKLRDTEQAITEFRISTALQEHAISPTILLSNDNQPYIKDQEAVYNLQFYVEHHKVNNSDIHFYNLGKTIALFHSATQSIPGIYEQNDRFALEHMWTELIQLDEFDNMEYKPQLLALFQQCTTYNHDNNCYIHGDLGIWNLLFNHNKMYIIDFGEVRKGNHHFDISAAISSALDWNQEDKIMASLTDFRNGYSSIFEPFHWNVLKENFNLWFTRGMMALLIHHGMNERTLQYVNLTLSRKNQLDSIIDAHFLQQP